MNTMKTETKSHVKAPEVQRRYHCFYRGNVYRPVQPGADNEAWAEEGRRLMFAHGTRDLEFFVAPKGVLTSGWVIGVFAL